MNHELNFMIKKCHCFIQTKPSTQFMKTPIVMKLFTMKSRTTKPNTIKLFIMNRVKLKTKKLTTKIEKCLGPINSQQNTSQSSESNQQVHKLSSLSLFESPSRSIFVVVR